MKRIIITIAIILFHLNAFAGGGWVQPKGMGYYKLSQWWIVADAHYTSTGEVDPNGTRATYFTSVFAEYGVTDRITGVVYWPFFGRSLVYEQVSGTTGEVITPGDAINGIGDMDLTVKYGLTKDTRIALSASLLLGLPLGESSGGRDGTLQTGDGEFNQMIQLDAGTSFNVFGLYPYVNAYAAFNNRTNGFSDEFRWGAEVGLSYKFLYANVRIQNVTSLKNGDSNFNTAGTSLFANNMEFLAITPEVGIIINDSWGVMANYGTAEYGRLIFANPTYSVGIFYKPK